MSVRKQIGQAVKLYESFRERKPRRIANLSVKTPKAVAVIGYLEGVDYRTTHGKQVTLYHHDFAPGSRPLLAVSADGKQLLLVGGRFQFTERGIVDRDAQGREIENAGHGKTINPRNRRKGNPSGEFIVERELRGKRVYVLDNGTTKDIEAATRMSKEYALKTARDFRISGGDAWAIPAPVRKGDLRASRAEFL